MKSSRSQNQQQQNSQTGNGRRGNDENKDESKEQKQHRHRSSHKKSKKHHKKEPTDLSNNEESSEFNRESERVEPRLMTKVVEEVGKVCFSMKPYMSCPKGSMTIEQEVMSDQQSTNSNGSEENFLCGNRHIPKISKLLRKSHTTEILDEMKDEKANKMLPVSIAKRCVRQETMSSDF